MATKRKYKGGGFKAEQGKGSSPSKTPTKKSSSKSQSKGRKYPTIKQYLGSDNVYQNSLSELMKNKEQFNIQNAAAQGDVQSMFGTAMDRLAKERGNSLTHIADDFGARGLVNSGLYGKSVSDYNEGYANQVQDLNFDKNTQLRDLGFEKSNMQGLIGSKKKDLRLDAIRRRAETIGARSLTPVSKSTKSGGGGSSKPVAMSNLSGWKNAQTSKSPLIAPKNKPKVYGRPILGKR